MRSIRTLLVLALLATGCSSAVHPRPAAPADGSASGTFVPEPDAYVPRRPGPLADALARTTFALRSSIERWTTKGDPSQGKAPRDVRLQALYQQRIYRWMARHDDVANATIAALPSWARGEAKQNLVAGRKLFSLVHPGRKHPPFRLSQPKPADVLRRFYDEAHDRFAVGWPVLAAVNYVESKFGRVTSASSAGAQGPMQFLPSTWEQYGMGGDIHDPHDAIQGAANYLHASGAPDDNRSALYAYNRSWAYVDAVLIYAKRIRNDPRAYYEYFNWQVFTITKDGTDKRLTGPGK